jgi:hypothetical protein
MINPINSSIVVEDPALRSGRSFIARLFINFVPTFTQETVNMREILVDNDYWYKYVFTAKTFLALAIVSEIPELVFAYANVSRVETFPTLF